MKKVLLTGASGFLGRACLPLLHAHGFEVCAVSSQVRSQNDGADFVHWHQVDLLQGHEIEAMIAKVRPTHLLHLGWCHTVPGKYWNSVENFRWVEVSLSLLQTFAAYGGERAVLAGTCAEYDWDYGYCSEQITPLRPATTYGICKHALQLLASNFGLQSGVNVAWGRLFFLYGPYEYPQRLVASVIRSLLQGAVASCTHGEQIRDFLHVHDAGAALVELLDSAITGPINIASGQPVTLKKVVGEIGNILQRGDLIRGGALPAPANDPPFLVADVQRLQQELAWSPQYDLGAGLSQTIEWWRTMQHSEQETT